MNTDYNITGNWVLWYHSLSDNKWTKTSYKNIYSIDNLLDLKNLSNIFNMNHLQNGMYFLMRRDIFPNWEDPDNRSGGCWSYKVPSKKIEKIWSNLVEKCIVEQILDYSEDKTCEENAELNMNEINGISISPKKEFNIIKIWNKNSSDIDNLKLDNIHKLLEDENNIYKKHLIDD